MSAYGMVSVDNHIERRGREWNPATELSPRQIDFLRAFDAMPGATLQAIADRLGITRATAAQHRDAAIALGVLGTSGYGKSRRVWLTSAGRRAIGVIDAEETTPPLCGGNNPAHDEGAAQGRAESSAGALAGADRDTCADSVGAGA
jgi:DNA-binding MarR family transcriptional regulator